MTQHNILILKNKIYEEKKQNVTTKEKYGIFGRNQSTVLYFNQKTAKQKICRKLTNYRPGI